MGKHRARLSGRGPRFNADWLRKAGDAAATALKIIYYMVMLVVILTDSSGGGPT